LIDTSLIHTWIEVNSYLNDLTINYGLYHPSNQYEKPKHYGR